MRQTRNVSVGAQIDFNNLMQKFIDSNTLRFTAFAELWSESKFSLIFMGRENERELREFVEECYRIVLEFLGPSFSLHRKVGAMYMLYGLYVKQPLQPKAKIRIMMNHFKDIKALFEISLREKHHDVGYIIQCLMSKFLFVAKPTMLGPRASVMGVAEVESSEGNLEDLMSSVHDLFEVGCLEQLSTFHKEYQRCKMTQPIQNIRNLNMIEDDVAGSVQLKLRNLIDSYIEQRPLVRQSSPQSDDEWTPSQSSRRAFLREKQFMAVANVRRARRHRAVQRDDSSSSPTKDFQRKRGRPRKKPEQDDNVPEQEEKTEDPSDDDGSEIHFDSGRIKKGRRGKR